MQPLNGLGPHILWIAAGAAVFLFIIFAAVTRRKEKMYYSAPAEPCSPAAAPAAFPAEPTHPVTEIAHAPQTPPKAEPAPENDAWIERPAACGAKLFANKSGDTIEVGPPEEGIFKKLAGTLFGLNFHKVTLKSGGRVIKEMPFILLPARKIIAPYSVSAGGEPEQQFGPDSQEYKTARILARLYGYNFPQQD